MAKLELNEAEVESILSLYHLGAPDEVRLISSARHHRTYMTRIGDRRLNIRLSAGRSFEDMLFEKDALIHLAEAGQPVARPLVNIAGGSFTPWGARGRYACLFEPFRGRALGRFEIREASIEAVATCLARIHRAGSDFERERVPPSDLGWMNRTLSRWERAADTRRIPKSHHESIERVGAELKRQGGRSPRGPVGLVHLDLDVELVHFERERLLGVSGFEAAATDRFALDLATLITRWTWTPAPHSSSGPAGYFDGRKLDVALRAYESIRPLEIEEHAELSSDLRYVVLQALLRKVSEFELRGDRSKEVPYQDFRHDLARLASLDAGDAELVRARR